MAPAVSVVIPTRDRPHYVRRAVRSVVAQSYPDLEVIVVDDGGAEEARTAVESIGDPRVRYVAQRHRGTAAARNTGIAAARGSYLAFLDDDDLWLPGKLARQVPVLEDGAAVVQSLVYVADARGKVYERPSRRGFAIFREVAAAGYPYPWLLRRSSFTMTSSVLRRSCVESVDGFDESLAGAEDVDLMLRLRRAYDFAFVDEPLSKYCFHGANTAGDTLAEGWRRLARKELETTGSRDREADAFLLMRLAQSEYILSRYRAAVRPAFRARRLDPRVLSRRELWKYILMTFVPRRLGDALRERRRRAHSAAEPDPWTDLG